MIKHFCFSNDIMTNSAGKCIQSALKYGCDSTNHFMPRNIDKEFWTNNIQILEQTRGAGYWLWKPYFILKMLNESQNGDIIVYTDAGLEFVSNVHNLIKEMDSDIMVFGNGWRHGDWCKRDVIIEMNAELYTNHDQLQASCLILNVSEYSKRFVSAWLAYCQIPGFIDDTPSQEPNEPTFREHRHDQAILTNLAIKENLTYNRWPAQYSLRGNEKYNNKYGQIFLHLGLRNNGKRV